MTTTHFKRRATRNPVAMDALLTRQGGRPQTVQVEDFSIDGCCVRGYFTVGERVELRLPRVGGFAADVRWARRGFAGLRFERAARA